jgi:hypothetical protein
MPSEYVKRLKATPEPMTKTQRAAGPYIVWEDGGCEGWSPTSYPTLKAALEGRKYSDWIVTRLVAYEVVEAEEKKDNG